MNRRAFFRALLSTAAVVAVGRVLDAAPRQLQKARDGIGVGIGTCSATTFKATTWTGLWDEGVRGTTLSLKATLPSGKVIDLMENPNGLWDHPEAYWRAP